MKIGDDFSTLTNDEVGVVTGFGVAIKPSEEVVPERRIIPTRKIVDKHLMVCVFVFFKAAVMLRCK